MSVDTKVISKVLELLLYPVFVRFAENHDLSLELSSQQNHYPDLTFVSRKEGRQIFAVDIKSAYRVSGSKIRGMTLGAFTGYFRNRESGKNTLYPYNRYAGHYVLGVLYSQSEHFIEEKEHYTLKDLATIPSVIRSFVFFAQPKYRIASTAPGSGNTKNIGSVATIETLRSGGGPFAVLGEAVYDDYWMSYLTADMARAIDLAKPPYFNLTTYLAHKQQSGKVTEILEAKAAQIPTLDEETAADETKNNVMEAGEEQRNSMTEALITNKPFDKIAVQRETPTQLAMEIDL